MTPKWYETITIVIIPPLILTSPPARFPSGSARGPKGHNPSLKTWPTGGGEAKTSPC